MSKSVKIKKVVLKIGKSEFALSLEEVKELQEVLDKAFAPTRTIYPLYPYWPYWNGNVIYTSSSGSISCATTYTVEDVTTTSTQALRIITST